MGLRILLPPLHGLINGAPPVNAKTVNVLILPNYIGLIALASWRFQTKHNYMTLPNYTG